MDSKPVGQLVISTDAEAQRALEGRDVLMGVLAFLDTRGTLAMAASCRYIRTGLRAHSPFWQHLAGTRGITARVRERCYAMRDIKTWRELWRLSRKGVVCEGASCSTWIEGAWHRPGVCSAKHRGRTCGREKHTRERCSMCRGCFCSSCAGRCSVCLRVLCRRCQPLTECGGYAPFGCKYNVCLQCERSGHELVGDGYCTPCMTRVERGILMDFPES